jgi:hypothetical protein
MATIQVSFDGTYLTDPTDPTISLHLFKGERPATDTLDGDVRVYAGGRRRVITSARKTRTSNLTFNKVSSVDLETLRDWRGRVLLIRDMAGWRWFGTYFSMASSAQWMGPDTPPIYTVDLTFTEVDYLEGA